MVHPVQDRLPYPAAFRQQMVELVRAGRSPAELSRAFNATAQSIANGVSQANDDAGVTGALTRAEREELPRLRRENGQLKTEGDILAKATAWFAVQGEKAPTSPSNS